MTMPRERTRALRWAGEFLIACKGRELPEDLARQIPYILRHYPSKEEIERKAKLGSAKSDPWLGPEEEAT